jgi:hypothetical protein
MSLLPIMRPPLTPAEDDGFSDLTGALHGYTYPINPDLYTMLVNPVLG